MRLSVRYIGMGSLMLISALGIPISHAEVYKWVDEHGVVNYAETPSPNQNAEKLSVEAATQAGAQAEKGAEAKEADKASEQADADARYKANLEELKKRCNESSFNLGLLKGDKPVSKEIDGKIVILSPEQRQAEIDSLEKSIQERCTGLQ